MINNFTEEIDIIASENRIEYNVRTVTVSSLMSTIKEFIPSEANPNYTR